MRNLHPPEHSIDLSDLFPGVKRALGAVDGKHVDIHLVKAEVGDHMMGFKIRLNIDKMANSLEMLRRAQSQ